MILALLLACKSDITVPIGKPVIQAAVDRKFPIEGGSEDLAKLTLDNPAIILPGGNRLGLDVDAQAAWRDVPVGEIASEALEELPKAETPAQATTQTLLLLQNAIEATKRAELITARGSGGIEGTLTYEDGSFYLHQAELNKLEIAEVESEKTETLRGLMQPPLAAALDRLPVYTLGEDLKQKAARFVLKDVQTDENGLLITLGLPE